MSYVIMVYTYDGMEFRGTDAEYDTREEAFTHLDEVTQNYPDGRYAIEELHDMAYYMRHHKELYDNDEQDLY